MIQSQTTPKATGRIYSTSHNTICPQKNKLIITCSTGSVPSDPLDSVLERCWTSEDFFWLAFCGSSGSWCACGAGLGGFGGAISDVGVFGVINWNRSKIS